jgi:hypothetical protein
MWQWNRSRFGGDLAAAFRGVSTSLSPSSVAALNEPLLAYHAQHNLRLAASVPVPVYRLLAVESGGRVLRRPSARPCKPQE